ncbi:MAG: hypothetical protein ACRCSB_02540, partial [Bacteroidales bacterium]
QTHFPQGVVDSEMLEYVEEQENTLATAIHSTDWLVADFLRFLEQEDILKNTVVYIFPDHTFMRGLELINCPDEPRKLWFMTNAKKESLSIDTSNFYQIDIAKNILSGAGVKHNMQFLSDFIAEDKNSYLKKNIKQLSALNGNAIARKNTLSGNLCFEIEKNNLLHCSLNGVSLFTQNIASITTKDSSLFLFLNNELKIIDQKIIYNLDEEYNYYESYIRLFVTKGKYIHLEWIRDNERKYSIRKSKKIEINSQEIQEILDKIAPYRINNADAYYPKKGTIQNSSSIDTLNKSLPAYLENALKDKHNLILISCLDEGSNYFGKIYPTLSNVGLKENLEGKNRGSYLAVFSKDTIYCEKAEYGRALHKRLRIEGTSIYITSSGWFEAPESLQIQSHIVIGNQDYSLNRRGLNIVVFNTQSKQVVDAFNVDTYDDETLSVMR